MAYDIKKAFRQIEEELTSSMIRNFKRHRLEEIKEGREWEQWQSLQLKALEEYRKKNEDIFPGRFRAINRDIVKQVTAAQHQGENEQESLLKILLNKKDRVGHTETGFFRINEKKMDALLNAVTKDMRKAESAVLRRANDQYRKIIFNAQVYANSGAATYEKAIDMATHDFLRAGIQCIRYKNGAMHTISDYASMAVRTANKRAYLMGQGNMRNEWGIRTVIANKRSNACPLCLPWVGKVMIDDVYSGGTASESKATGYPTISQAMSAGFLHPNCKDSVTTYFPGISDPPDKTFTKQEINELGEKSKKDAATANARRRAGQLGRMAKYSLDPDNQKTYASGTEKNASNLANVDMIRSFKGVAKGNVVKVLRKEYKQWSESLTGKELHAIHKCTMNSFGNNKSKFYERLNAMLRGDIPENKKLRDYAETISGAIKKKRLEHSIFCYRRMEVNPYPNAVKGEILPIDQFISTSVIKTKTMKGDFEMVILAPPGTPGVFLDTGVSRLPKQREFLIDKGCKYRIKSIEKNKMVLIVEV